MLVKVNSVSDGETVTTREGLKVRKQDCSIEDSSASLKLVLWVEDVGCMDTRMSYRVEGAVVKSYVGIKYLSVGKSALWRRLKTLEKGMKADEVEEENELCSSGSAGHGCVVEGEINGVLKCAEYLSCIS